MNRLSFRSSQISFSRLKDRLPRKLFFLMFCSSIQKRPSFRSGLRVSHGYSCSRWRVVGPLSDGLCLNSCMASQASLHLPPAELQEEVHLTSCWAPPSKLTRIFRCHFVTDLDLNPNPATSSLILWLPTSYLAFLSAFPHI